MVAEYVDKKSLAVDDIQKLLDEIEQSLQLHTFPMNWPLGDGQGFKGVFDRRRKQVHFFERVPGGAYRAPVTVMDRFDEEVLSRLDTITRKRVIDEISVLDHAGEPFDAAAVKSGDMTPVFFGSAMNNFGVQMLLDGFLELSPPPRAQNTLTGSVAPEDPRFSGFIFKIQSNHY